MYWLLDRRTRRNIIKKEDVEPTTHCRSHSRYSASIFSFGDGSSTSPTLIRSSEVPSPTWTEIELLFTTCPGQIGLIFYLGLQCWNLSMRSRKIMTSYYFNTWFIGYRLTRISLLCTELYSFCDGYYLELDSMKSIPKSNLDVVSFRFKLWLALKCSSLDKYRCSPNLITHHARGNIDPISKISSHPFTTQHVFGIAGQRVIILSHRFLNWKYRHAANFWWESAPLVLAMCMTRVHYIGPSLN